MSGKKRHFDWDAVKSRLRRNQQALEDALTTNPEQLAAVYRDRAAQLARRLGEGATPVAGLRVLVFMLGAERYGLKFVDLAAILPFAGCTRVPGGPAELLGVTNIEGEIRSVLDLARILDLPAQPAESTRDFGARSNAASYILLVRKLDRQVAFRVDGVDQIRRIAPEEFSTPGDTDAGPALRYLWGLTADRLKVLSSEALLTHPIFGKTASG